MKPSIGRIVHYVDERGAHLAALITWVYSDGTSVDLTCFYRQTDAGTHSGGMTVARVHNDGEASHESWHWPERVD
jgi:hypothetical protein